MKRFRFRLSLLLWLVVIAAAVLWGIRYWQDRKAVRTIVGKLSFDDMADRKIEVNRGQEPSQGRGER
jgi:hypothetical protein